MIYNNTLEPKIYIETLGCPRNKVDSEYFYYIAAEIGLLITDEPKGADIILINTCGFINEAKEESIDQIILLSQFCSADAKILVTGCLVKRYEDELRESLPEIDHFIPLKDYIQFRKVLNKYQRLMIPQQNILGRKLINRQSYAYLKIADGCENYCSYCAIPSIRGNIVSEPIDSLVSQSLDLSSQGIKELVVTAMDITQYGKDLPEKVNILNLLTKLIAIEEIEWIRLLYLHPKGITSDLINIIKDNDKICPYLDIPIQHINNTILKSMNRSITRYEIESLLDNIRTLIPNVVLRTSIIVGYPGETEEQFEELFHFIEKTRFNRLGVFTYSKEEGTTAYNISNQVHFKTAQKRKRLLMELQEQISESLLSQYIGKVLPVIIDKSFHEGEEHFIEGRTRYDAPGIDGIVQISGSASLKPGSIVNAEIIDSWEHDLVGKITMQR